MTKDSSIATIGVHKNTVNFPDLQFTPLSTLTTIDNGVQRVEYKKHTKAMEDKIMENGFMDAIKVFPKDTLGNYKVAEASHRVRGLKNIFQSDENPMVPIAILHWKDGEDHEEVLNTIIEFNVSAKTWTLYDYVKAHAEANHYKKEVSDTWRTMLSDMKRLKPRITNSVVVGVYTGDIRNQPRVKDLKKARNFYLNGDELFYAKTMISRFESLVDKVGKGYATHAFLRNYAYNLNRIAKILKNRSVWEKFFQSSIKELDVLWKAGYFFPESDDAFDRWFYTEELKNAGVLAPNSDKK